MRYVLYALPLLAIFLFLSCASTKIVTVNNCERIGDTEMYRCELLPDMFQGEAYR